MNKRRIVFVINPNSGTDKKTDRMGLIRSLVNADYDAEVILWKKVEDKDSIFNKVKNGNYDIAVAVGGDGTVSQLAEVLIGTSTALGIIPFGSGNGLARHLGIPMDKKAAMNLLNYAEIKTIDYGSINNQPFFCTSGVGFDARIGKLFAESKSRGLKSYVSITINQFRNYSHESYTIEYNGKREMKDAFLITVANAGQYGNNAWIAPDASVEDGLMHVSILKPFRWWNMAGLAFKLFSKKITQSAFLESFHCKSITIHRTAPGPVHFDGEPAEMGKILEFKIHEKGLKVAVPPGVKI